MKRFLFVLLCIIGFGSTYLCFGAQVSKIKANISSFYTVYITEENPWVENFDTTTAQAPFPSCIDILQSNTINDVVYPIVVDTTLATTLPSALLMRGTNTIALPIIDKEFADCSISFYVVGTGSINIGTVNDTIASSFVSVITRNVTAYNTTRYEIDLNAYSNLTGNRLAIQSSSNADFLLDSVTIHIRSGCHKPFDVTTVEIGDTSARFEFQVSPLSYQIEYMVSTLTEDLIRDTIPVTSQIEITGLNPETYYLFYVRSFCTDSCISDWTTKPFTTMPTPLQAPFVLDFENNSVDAMFKTKNVGVTSFVFGNYSSAVRNGMRALYISTDNGVSNDYNITSSSFNYAILPVLITPGSYEISYYWKAGGDKSTSNYAFDYGRVFLAPMSFNVNSYSSVYPGLSNSSLPDNCIALDDGSALAKSYGKWIQQSTTFSTREDIRMKLVFFWRNDNSSGFQPAISFDDFTITKYICDEGIDSTKINVITNNSVTFSVYPFPELRDSITYIVRSNSNVTVDSATVNVAANNKITVAGLTPLTDYTIELYGYCNESATHSSKVSFKTFCDPVIVNDSISYFEDFDSCSRYNSFLVEFPCWHYKDLYGLSVMYPDDNAYQGANSISVYYYNDEMISRLFSLTPGSYEISVYARSEYPGAEITFSCQDVNSTVDTKLITRTVGNVYDPIVAKLDIANAGDYIISIEFNTLNLQQGDLFFDNLSIIKTSLMRPYNLAVDNITVNSADISWSSYHNTHKLRLFDDNNQLVIDTIIRNALSISLSGLKQSTNYRVELNAISDDEQSLSEVVTISFNTNCGAFNCYFNDFDRYSTKERPICWELEAYTSSGDDYIDNNNVQWEVYNLNGRTALMLYSSYMSLRSINIVYSPELYITQGSMLSFDYFNNNDNVAGKEDSLVVSIVSNGVESEPILIADYIVANNGWNSFSYDMSAYEGNTVKIKFMSRSYYYATGRFIGIDNFNVSGVSKIDTFNVVVFPNTDYNGYGFNVNADQLVVGDTTTFTRRDKGNECDVITVLNVIVPSPDATVIYDTICKGDVYNTELFTGLNEPGIYMVNLVSANGGDSSVVLCLNVLDLYYNINLSLCEGQTYNFAGQTITSAGIYTDTLVRACGCDSIVTLTVTNTAKYYEETAYFCQFDSYFWQKTATFYYTPGRYENVLTNAAGCDSIEVLNLIMLPVFTYSLLDLCQGDSYDFDGQIITEAGEYAKSFKNILGCDSDVVLSVSSIPTVYENITATINDGDTYEFGGELLTQAGTYEHTFSTDKGCDSVVTLTLNVITSADNAYALPIVVAPSPVLGGQSTYVTHEWTAAEQNGMRVEVLNSVGQVVEVFTPTTYPIEVKGINVSGIYIIRVTSGTGNVYLGRLVVK